VLNPDVEPITLRVADVRPSDGIDLARRLGAPIPEDPAAFRALRPVDEAAFGERPLEWL
jgi:hypothetical protein